MLNYFRLRKFGLFSPEEKICCGDLVTTFQYMKGPRGKPERRDSSLGTAVVGQGVIGTERGEI